MSDIRIKNIPGNYENGDVYNCLLGYISKKAYIGGFGFACTPELSIIEQFRLSEICSKHPGSRKMWHFIITFQEEWGTNSLLTMAIRVSSLFAERYQILWGLDYDKKIPHLHFGMNAFSYHLNIPPLSEIEMHECLAHIQQMLQKENPNKTVTLKFTTKEK